jgi:hypothetical protein
VTFPRAPDEGGSPWTSVETPHFALATDMEKTRAENLARMLEDTWTAMEYALESFSAGALENNAGSEPVLAVALKNDREREAVHKQLGIFSAQPLLPPVVSIGDIDANRGTQVVQHELAHALLAKRLPRVPRWLTEGVAVYLETAQLDREGHTVTWGTWNANDMEQLRGGRVPIDAVFDTERWKITRETYEMEMEAGLLVHMLVNHYPGELACYLKRLATDPDPTAAMACFPGRTGWTYEVKEYDYEASAARKQAYVTFPNVQVSTTVMGDASVHAVLALLDYLAIPFVERQFQGDRVERAERHVARALEIDRADRLAIMLRLTHTDQSNPQRAELTKRLVESHPDHWATWVARAATPGIPEAEQFAATDRAWALAPGRAEVLHVAAIRAFVEARWSDARTLRTKAWFGGLDDEFGRALIYAASLQLGSCAEADSWLPPPNARTAFITRVAQIRKDVDAPAAPCPVPP